MGEHDLRDLGLDGLGRQPQALPVGDRGLRDRAPVRCLHVSVRERVAVALEQLALGVVPHRLGVEEQAVHVEDGGAEAAGQDERDGGGGRSGHGQRAASGDGGVTADCTGDVPATPKIDDREAKPNRGHRRLRRVNANPMHHSDHPVALELLLRLMAVALVAFAILGLLPAIAQAAL